MCGNLEIPHATPQRTLKEIVSVDKLGNQSLDICVRVATRLEELEHDAVVAFPRGKNLICRQHSIELDSVRDLASPIHEDSRPRRLTPF
jgi:hypothetical protein